MVSRNTTLVPSLGLRIGPACKAGLSAGMRMEGVSPQIRKKERQDFQNIVGILLLCVCGVDQVHCMLAMRYVKLMETVSLVRRLKLYSGHWSVTAHSLYSLNVTIVLFQAIINGQASLHEIVRIFCIKMNFEVAKTIFARIFFTVVSTIFSTLDKNLPTLNY